MNIKQFWLIIGIVMLTPVLALAAQYGSMRNGSFDQAEQHKATDPSVVKAKEAGWKLPADLVWPAHWGPNPATPNGSLEYLRDAGLKGTPAVRVNGGHIASYFGRPEPDRRYVATVRVKGHGTLWLGAYHYSKDGFIGPRPAFVERDVDADYWVEYEGVFENDDPEIVGINPALQTTGSVVVDEVELAPAGPADVEMVKEKSRLYGTGALIENLEIEAVKADDAFAVKLADYRRAVEDFRAKKDKAETPLRESLEQKIAGLRPYLATKGAVVMAAAYNDMIVLTRVLRKVVGKEGGLASPAPAKAAATPALDHKPGVRRPRPGTITITNVRSNKVRYDENETARTTATIVNKSSTRHVGTLIALMHLDLDEVREIARTAFRIGAGRTKQWSFSYNVGPETYGRGVEVRFVDASGKVLDSWQEFYAVAAEWFRVHQHTYAAQNKLYKVDPWATYYNQRHYFANEPTDFGVHTTDAEQWISGQAGYRINAAARKAEIRHFSNMGLHHTFYQTFAFCGQMGYEEMRKHPEYALYDENGQFAVDPIYGGYPNPMELASPIEAGPKRQADKPYLDRTYTPWQHCPANFAREDAVVYQTKCIKKYAEEHGFTGVYIDGNMGVLKGYNYDGAPNVPSGKPEDYAKLSARNHRVFSEILKKDNPNFGTWFNWGYRGVEWSIRVGLTAFVGSGTGARGDVGDENIKAATQWRNVMLLYETGSFLKSAAPPSPEEFLARLIEQRDFAVQKWGANTIIGYSFVEPHVSAEKPGPSKWAWPTLNYVGAQLIATQVHHAGGFLPSYRPTLQFMTRYSRFLWARDIKALPAAEVERTVQVASPEDIWWKRLVYRRKTDDGYDLIVHLVRIPPTKKWDINWVHEPAPLKGVKVTALLGSARLRDVQSARPWHFEEEQQPVQTVLKGREVGAKASVDVPPFRYHTMVVFRVTAR